MIDWSTVASLATAGGTLVLAVATFASIRSANRSARTADRAARTAERSLLAAQRPLLVNSRLQDPKQKIQYPEGLWLTADGGTAAFEVTDQVVYLALSIRNVGTGLAVLRDPAADIFPACPARSMRRHPAAPPAPWRLRGRAAGHHPVLAAPPDRALAHADDQALQRGPARSPLSVPDERR